MDVKTGKQESQQGREPRRPEKADPLSTTSKQASNSKEPPKCAKWERRDSMLNVVLGFNMHLKPYSSNIDPSQNQCSRISYNPMMNVAFLNHQLQCRDFTSKWKLEPWLPVRFPSPSIYTFSFQLINCKFLRRPFTSLRSLLNGNKGTQRRMWCLNSIRTDVHVFMAIDRPFPKLILPNHENECFFLNHQLQCRDYTSK